MKQLEDLGIEFRDEDKYTTTCPQCANTRRKQNTKTLCVWREDDKIKFKCYHSKECPFHDTQHIALKHYNESSGKSQMRNLDGQSPYLPLPDSETPPVPAGSTLYTYYVDSIPSFYICRTAEKRFIPFSWTSEGWVAKRPNTPCLYRSTLLQPTGPVIVVEGEKTADVAAEIFKHASVVSWVGGAANVQSGDWDLLKGRQVVIWPDNDKPGIQAADKIAKLIDSLDVYIVDTSSLPEKADLADDIDIELIKKLYREKKNASGPIIRGLYNSNNLASDLTRRVDGLLFGWPSVDKFLRLPNSGVVVIQGRTNHGKSAFMVNLTSNLLRKTDAVVLYVSYEIPAADTQLKLVKCFEEKQYSDTSFENDKIYANRMINNESEGYKELTKYENDARLYITDEQITVDEIVKAMQRLKKLGVPVVICLDYFQLIPTNGTRERYLEVKNNVERIRTEANKIGAVVVGGSQLTNGDTPYADQSRESKDITFTAELVLKIWNKLAADTTGTYKVRKTAEGEKKVDYYAETPGDFVLDVVKSRQGGLGKKFGFNLVNGIKFNEPEDFKQF